MELPDDERREKFQEGFMEKAAHFMQEMLDLVAKIYAPPAIHTNGQTNKRPREEDEEEEEEMVVVAKEEKKKKPKKKKNKKEVEKEVVVPAIVPPTPAPGAGVEGCAGRFWCTPPQSCVLVEEGRSTEGIELKVAQKFPGAAGKCKLCTECGKKRKNFNQSERNRKKKEQKQNEQQPQ